MWCVACVWRVCGVACWWVCDVRAECCGLYAMTRVDSVAVAFPFFIGALVFVRRWALPAWFTADELAALDA